MPITSAVARYITYPNIRNIDYVSLNTELDNIYWEQAFTLANANDQLSFIQENMRWLYDRCVPVKTRLIIYKQQPLFTTKKSTN